MDHSIREWLLEDETPEVKLRMLKEYEKLPENDERVIECKRRLLQSKVYERGLKKLRTDKPWAKYDAILAFAEWGLTREDIGSDIDDEAVQLTLENARKAGVEKRITVVKRDIKDFCEEHDRAAVICNPPYGERLLDMEQARDLYRIMGQKFIRKSGWSYSIISPDDSFEAQFGRAADKRRKLYNGMIKCQLYMYYKN